MKKKSVLMTIIIVSLLPFLATTVLPADTDVSQPMNDVIKADPRNSGVGMTASYGSSPTILVLDMQSITGTKSPMDVFRVLLQYAAKIKSKTFDRVELTCKGKIKFLLKGNYFKTLGVEYGTQNPMYTIRTFPQNLARPDGTRAFPVWTGGLIGVSAKQMEDFKNVHMQWYITDLLK